jgi:hypothetical protein
VSLEYLRPTDLRKRTSDELEGKEQTDISPRVFLINVNDQLTMYRT